MSQMNNLFSPSMANELIHGPLKTPSEVPAGWLEVALKITMGFEGTTWATTAGNFDGMGLSAGILQWNYGQGSLQSKILQPYINKYGVQKLDSHFPGVGISESAYMSPAQAVDWAKKKFPSHNQMSWFITWGKFLTRESVIEIQKEATKSLASKAFQDAVENDMLTLRSFCWFFDVYVQNGSLKGIQKRDLTITEKVKTLFANITGKSPDQDIPGPLQADLTLYEKNLSAEISGPNLKLWRNIGASKECQILFNWICERANKNQWRSDVIIRKGTIAHGAGWVHGKYYDLNQMAMPGVMKA